MSIDFGNGGFTSLEEINVEPKIIEKSLLEQTFGDGLDLSSIDFNYIEKLIPNYEKYLQNQDFVDSFKYVLNQNKNLLDNIVFVKLFKQIIDEEQAKGNQEKAKGNQEKAEIEEDNNIYIEAKNKLRDETIKLVKELNLESNPNYESWKQKATSNLLSSNPELKDKPEELENLVNSYVLIENRQELAKDNPELNDKLQSIVKLSLQTEYSKVFENIFKEENSTVIDTLVNSGNGYTNVENDIAKASIIPDGNKAKIDGNNIISYSGKTEEAAQIVELSENKLPKKYISKYGYKLETTQTFITDTSYQLKKQEYQTQYQQLDKDLKMSKDILNNILSQDTTLLPDGELKDFLELYKINKSELNQLNPNDDLFELKKETLTNQINEIEQKIQKEVLKIQQNIENINQEIQKISVSANKLQQEENSRLINFKQLQINADKKAEDTLDFLHNLGLTNIPQHGLERLFERLNIEQNLDPKLDLNNGFEGSITNKNLQKEKVFNIFSKLYEKMGIDVSKLDKTKIINGNDQLFKNQDFQRVIKDFIFNESGFDFLKIFNILNSNPTEKEKTPNKVNESSQRLMYA